MRNTATNERVVAGSDLYALNSTEAIHGVVKEKPSEHTEGDACQRSKREDEASGERKKDKQTKNTTHTELFATAKTEGV